MGHIPLPQQVKTKGSKQDEADQKHDGFEQLSGDRRHLVEKF
jgi:hypothetical protein